MLWLYVTALVAGGGVLALQLILSHDGDGDSSAHGHDHSLGGTEAALWPLVTSIRFWTFALLAFGLFGVVATLLGGSAGLVGVLATIVGFVSGTFAFVVVRRLARSLAGSRVTVAGVVGKIGRVVVALEDGRAGKVRVDLSGEFHDVMARAEAPIAAGERVIVESFDGSIAVVSRAPEELRLGP